MKHLFQSRVRAYISGPYAHHLHIKPQHSSIAAAATASFATVPKRVTATTTTTTTNKNNSNHWITVALLGPPNAGKSTLFNRLMDKEANKSYRLSSEKKTRPGRRVRGRLSATLSAAAASNHGGALVSHVPGTTRDRRTCVGRLGGTYFSLADTAGVDGQRLRVMRRQVLMRHMMEQTIQAAQQAELILLLLDAKVGVTSDLIETARWLRKVANQGQRVNKKRRVVIVANKLEGTHWDYDGSPVLEHLNEATRVGFGVPVPISALHGEGMADLAVIIDELTAEKRAELGITNEAAEETAASDDDNVDKPLQLAILGRQNVGKSTIVNSLLQQDRVIVGPTPGLTRDAIAIEWTWNNRPVQLVDTAGIRKRANRDHSNDIEDMAVQDAMRAMKVADVAVLVLDAGARTMHRQELAIADQVLKEGRALVVAANKMDLILERGYGVKDFEKGVRNQLEGRFPMLRQTPIVPMSALEGSHVHDLMPVVFKARDRWARKIPTGHLNRWLAEVLMGHPPPPVNGKATKIKYIMQTKGRPPTFLLFCNSGELAEGYIRYLTRNFQDTFDMYGMEVRLAVKRSALTNPYEPSKKRTGGIGLGGKEGRIKRFLKHINVTGTTPGKKAHRNRKRKRNYS
jgi:GTP-binding protein